MPSNEKNGNSFFFTKSSTPGRTLSGLGQNKFTLTKVKYVKLLDCCNEWVEPEEPPLLGDWCEHRLTIH